MRALPSLEPGMTPREIWCNEAQERYVLAIAPTDLDRFRAICERERCPFAVVGTATGDARLVVRDPHFRNAPVDMNLDVLLGKPPKMVREAAHVRPSLRPLLAFSLALNCYAGFPMKMQRRCLAVPPYSACSASAYMRQWLDYFGWMRFRKLSCC